MGAQCEAEEGRAVVHLLSVSREGDRAWLPRVSCEGELRRAHLIQQRPLHGPACLVCQVVCGQDHSLVLTDKGEVYSCGWGADGQTGRCALAL